MTHSTSADHTTPDPAAVLYLATWLPSELHSQFSAWCDGHHRDQLSIPGILRARRFEYVDGTLDEPPQFLTMYEVTSLNLFQSPAYLDHRAAASQLPQFLAGKLRVTRRDCTIDAALPSEWWPPFRTEILDEFYLNNDELDDEFRRQGATGVAGLTRDMVLRVLSNSSDDSFVLFDHNEAQSSFIDTIARVTGATRSHWRCVFDELAT